MTLTNTYSTPQTGDFVFQDFRLASGAALDEVRIHYRTLGEPRRDEQGVVRNAVLILHGTTGQGGNFLNEIFAGELFGDRFPRYGYRDMIAAQYRLVSEGLQINHLRLVMGTSMGGMHTWLWGQIYPDFMDALLPLASLPTQISGRNRMWRKLLSDAIRSDLEWNNGEYQEQPRSLSFAAGLLFLMASNPLMRQQQAPTFSQADRVFEAAVAEMVTRLDANDVLYAIESSWDYDPSPGLERIQAPLLAINFADDLVNPPELGILEREIQRVRRGKAIVMPLSEATVGHGTHTKAGVWKHHLVDFLRETAQHDYVRTTYGGK
ncbi:MAG: hypothetical protein DCC55_26465 [Chloroflexi bacterium]|nr:MAG: hypothetical protein DCC55_26465 [Chloroflexota bacterium]